MFLNQNKSTRKIAPIASSAFVALMVIGGLSLVPAANAVVTFNPTSGQGFVGKGDVQTALGLNNQQLQAQAQSIALNGFTVTKTTVTEQTWECTNTNNERIQERTRTTTTDSQQVVASATRDRNQVTGFNLNGYGGTISSSSETEGPPVNSCPANPSGWVLTSPAGQPTVISESGVLQVRGVTIYTF
jgi:hypothetical protein